MLDDNAVWLITGCSKGLGLSIARQALEAGYRVVATARDAGSLAGLSERYGDRVLTARLDVTDPGQIQSAVALAHEWLGRIDVLVNNAGAGYFGAIEEGEDAGVRAVFETNLFGPLNLAKAVLPGMRAKRCGHIVNISSIGGFVTYPAVGYYHMTKFALEAMSESLAKEVAPLGVHSMVVEPGAFLTDFRGLAPEKQPATRIADYADTAGKARDAIFEAHGKQQGDPDRAGRAIIDALRSPSPPLRLLLGGDALDQARARLKELSQLMDEWEATTRGTSFQ
ncbi:short-chain dehydrogenase/reductase [Bordetella genomosp. 8]|uniref:Short-chain dehydrogenase/reductase n=1 Tax=Bordetella genomosp. 8 TaxID=1416806 RepID=A0A1W6YLG5_9BORD|nr:oxidoreductase [Bordetella genomosp. 8]ARP81871.1 short-chain dehydrogenase/reductase [Bordetella genomosp. 8]